LASQLEIRSVDAAYGAIKVLFSVDLVVPEGGVVALLGPNGAGKTTVLKVAAGSLTPTTGSVWVNGSDVTLSGQRARARLGMCLVPEGRGIFPNLTIRENLLLHTYARPGSSAGELEDIVYGRFPVLGKRRKQVAGTLSGGEQQMLALSRALTSNPRLLLLDEISMGLGPLIVEELFAVIREEVVSKGISVLIVEQLADLALGIADHAAVMSRGAIIASGSPAEVKEVLESAYLGDTQTVAGMPDGSADSAPTKN
jgi:branched-chain amino acid transport system ATP-binding protein